MGIFFYIFKSFCKNKDAKYFCIIIYNINILSLKKEDTLNRIIDICSLYAKRK